MAPEKITLRGGGLEPLFPTPQLTHNFQEIGLWPVEPLFPNPPPFRGGGGGLAAPPPPAQSKFFTR